MIQRSTQIILLTLICFSTLLVPAYSQDSQGKADGELQQPAATKDSVPDNAQPQKKVEESEVNSIRDRLNPELNEGTAPGEGKAGGDATPKTETPAQGGGSVIPGRKDALPQPGNTGENAIPEQKAEVLQPGTPGESVTPKKNSDILQPGSAAEGISPAQKAGQLQPGQVGESTLPEQKTEILQQGNTTESILPTQKVETTAVQQEEKKILALPMRQADEPVRKNYLLGNYLGDTRIMAHYGIFSPISDYGEFYSNTTQIGLGAQLREFALWQLNPEAHASYAKMESIAKENRVHSTMELAQISLGISYYYDMELPRFARSIGLRQPLGLFARLMDGVTRVRFESDLVSKPEEYIHTVGFSAGAVYPVFRGVYVGPEVGYQYIFTANNALQSVIVAVKAEVRL